MQIIHGSDRIFVSGKGPDTLCEVSLLGEKTVLRTYHGFVNAEATKVRLSFTSNTLCSGDGKAIKFWNINNERVLPLLMIKCLGIIDPGIIFIKGFPTHVAVLGSGSTSVMVAYSPAHIGFTFFAAKFELNRLQRIPPVRKLKFKYPGSIHSIKYSHNGKFVFVISEKGPVRNYGWPGQDPEMYALAADGVTPAIILSTANEMKLALKKYRFCFNTQENSHSYGPNFERFLSPSVQRTRHRVIQRRSVQETRNIFLFAAANYCPRGQHPRQQHHLRWFC